LRKTFNAYFSFPAITTLSFKASIYAGDKLKLDFTRFESVIKQRAMMYGLVNIPKKKQRTSSFCTSLYFDNNSSSCLPDFGKADGKVY